MAADVEAKVKEIIVNKLGVDEGQITPLKSICPVTGYKSSNSW